MKLFFLISILVLCFSCKSKSGIITNKDSKNTTSTCPDSGQCTFEVIKNKRLNIKKDDFGNTYPEIVDGNGLVLKFQFVRDPIPNTADSGYREVVFMELDSDLSEIQLENQELQNVKLLFGRLCFCGDQTGYYRINTGNLSIVRSNVEHYRLILDFTCDSAPQMITSLNEQI